jgi:hypothetical protein
MSVRLSVAAVDSASESGGSIDAPVLLDRPVRAHLVRIDGDGTLLVRIVGQVVIRCDWVQQSVELSEGDELLVFTPTNPDTRGVVVGRIGQYREPAKPAHASLESSETLTLRCGQSSIDLRADGKVLIKGEDVTVRAKGTQRIRAGTVSIN